MTTLTSFPIETSTIPERAVNTALQDTDLFITDQGGSTKQMSGETSKQGHGGIIPWTIGFSFLEGGYCDRNGVQYRSKQAHSGQDPELDTTNIYWEYAKIAPTPSVTGSATFTNSTNNIALPSIGAIDGLEVGDVLQVSGSTNNDTEFTVEIITDDDNVIVNQAHAGGTTTKSLVDETATVTITLLAKWYNAPIGLGQGWVDVASSRSDTVNYTPPTNRSIKVSISITSTSSGINARFYQDSIAINKTLILGLNNNSTAIVSEIAAMNTTYKIDDFDLNDSVSEWTELR